MNVRGVCSSKNYWLMKKVCQYFLDLWVTPCCGTVAPLDWPGTSQSCAAYHVTEKQTIVTSINPLKTQAKQLAYGYG